MSDIAERFAKKYLIPKDIKKGSAETKAYISSGYVMMIETNRADLQNALINYEELDKERYERIKKDCDEQTTQAIFDIEYLTDALNMLSEIESTGDVTIRLGNNIPITFSIKNKQGEKVEITIAHREPIKKKSAESAEVQE